MMRALHEKVDAEHAFHVKGGGAVRNVYELRDALMEMDDESFLHHVTEEKNDFKRWAHDIIKDSALAEALGSSSTRLAMLTAVNSHIHRHEHLEHHAACEHKEHLGCGLRDFLLGVLVGLLIGLMLAGLF